MGLCGKKHSIGKTIAELRKAKGWTQIELAEKLQVSDKAISKWEKDSGAPSIEFFPALAELFDVSIDYLMMGKETEPEVITMSKIELCAKNDDVALAKEINLQTKDENGRTLIDYIIQYKSYKVFAEICEKINSKKFGVDRYIEYALITNKTNAIEGIKENYVHVEDKSYYDKKDGVKPLCLITDKLLDVIVLDKRVKSETIDYLLSNQKDRQCVWYLVLPYLLHQSYLHNNKELFNEILNASIVSNNYAYEHFKIPNENSYARNYYHFGHFLVIYNIETGVYIDSLSKKHGLVRVLEKTIKLALERSDIETVEKLNNLNTAVMKYSYNFKCYIATADEIRIAKLKLDKTVSKDEIKIQSTIHEGVVCIDELLELKDFKIIKKVLNEYPIHIVELLDEWLSKSKWKELYRFAIDNNNENLANAIITKDDKEYIKRAIQEYFKKDKYNFNKKYFYLYENSRQKSIASPNKEQFDKIKQRIIDELALKIDKDSTVGDLTKEYFESELGKSNTDMVIIKLCVRLEAVLRCDYHYEGDLSVMIDKYCQEHGWEDDGWGYSVEANHVKYLQKLRKKRNNIVHSEKNRVDLTLEEIKYCIDYICKMG